MRPVLKMDADRGRRRIVPKLRQVRLEKKLGSRTDRFGRDDAHGRQRIAMTSKARIRFTVRMILTLPPMDHSEGTSRALTPTDPQSATGITWI